jgi:Transposase IS66 family
MEPADSFLDHPILELSTNAAENAIRPVALGRKNWIHFGSQQAGPRIAAILSIVETCRNHIRICTYSFVIRVLIQEGIMADLDQLKAKAHELQVGLGESPVLSALILASTIRDAADYIGQSIRETGRKYTEATTQEK